MDYLTAQLVAGCFPQKTSIQLFSLCKEFATDPIIEGYAANNGILNGAAAVGNINHVKKLLQNKMINLTITNKPIRLACEYGHINIVKILLDDNRMNPFDITSDDYNDEYIECPIMVANENCHFDIIKLLLNDVRYNDLDNWSYKKYVNDILHNASINGNINMVQFIVEKFTVCRPRWDDRIIDNYKNNRYIHPKCAKDYLDILQTILTHPNFELDPDNINHHHNSYYTETIDASGNDTELLKVLLLLPNKNINYAEINSAISNNNIINLKLLLAYNRINLEDDYDIDPRRTSIYIACTFNNIEMIKLLLNIGRDPSLNNNEALYYAIKNNNFEIIQLLMLDSRVINTMNNNNRISKLLRMKENDKEAKLFLESAGVDISDPNVWLV